MPPNLQPTLGVTDCNAKINLKIEPLLSLQPVLSPGDPSILALFTVK